MSIAWSIILAVIGILGIYLAGKRNYWGWALGLAAQALWILYAIATKQWGFIASALAYGYVYGRNFYAWRKEQKTIEGMLRTVSRRRHPAARRMFLNDRVEGSASIQLSDTAQVHIFGDASEFEANMERVKEAAEKALKAGIHGRHV